MSDKWDTIRLTKEEFALAKQLDCEAKLQQLDHRERHTVERKKTYYETHRDERLAYQRQYTAANSERIRKRQAAYRKRTREARRQYWRDYYEANRDAVLEKRRKKREAQKACGEE